jgi:putative PIN family toxin of toxin-antitoxin system
MRSPRGASAAILRMAAEERVVMLLSVGLAMEYESVCRRPEHRHAAGLTAAELDVFVNTLVGLAAPVEIHFLWRPALRDAGDEMVLEAAVSGRADAIVTFNRRDYGSAPSGFGIEVLSPGEAVRKLRSA